MALKAFFSGKYGLLCSQLALERLNTQTIAAPHGAVLLPCSQGSKTPDWSALNECHRQKVRPVTFFFSFWKRLKGSLPDGYVN